MFTVAVIGADGAGKTTLTRRLAAELGRPAVSLYMGENPAASSVVSPPVRAIWARRARRGRLPEAGGPPPEPGAEEPGGLRPWFHVGILLTEEWYRQYVTWREGRRGNIVLFDRHFLADYDAHDVRGPSRSRSRRFHGFVLRRLYPRPSLSIVLDAPAEVLYERKAEGSVEDLERRRREYLDFAASDPAALVVDVDRPIDEVADELRRLIEASLLGARVSDLAG